MRRFYFLFASKHLNCFFFLARSRVPREVGRDLHRYGPIQYGGKNAYCYRRDLRNRVAKQGIVHQTSPNCRRLLQRRRIKIVRNQIANSRRTGEKHRLQFFLCARKQLQIVCICLQLSAELGDYRRSINIFEEIAIYQADHPTLKYAAKNQFFMALLCQLCENAVSGAFVANCLHIELNFYRRTFQIHSNATRRSRRRLPIVARQSSSASSPRALKRAMPRNSPRLLPHLIESAASTRGKRAFCLPPKSFAAMWTTSWVVTVMTMISDKNLVSKARARSLSLLLPRSHLLSKRYKKKNCSRINC